MTMSEVEIIEVIENNSQKDSQEQQKQQDPQTPKPPAAFKKQQQQPQRDQNSKDRTLFCINIDQRCTEDILYELFLQAGPIDDIVRKPDRNGNIIALITYKHIESVDYAIKLFDKILLYGQKLKVQLSQGNSKPVANNSDTPNTTPVAAGNATNNPQSPNLVSGYSKPYTRTQSYDSIVGNRQQQQQQQQQHQQMQPPVYPPQIMPMNNGMPMPFNLLQFMTQPLIPFNNDPNNFSPQMQSHNRHHNQSPSPNQSHNSRYDNHSRNSQSSRHQHRDHHDDHYHHHNQHQHNRQNSRDNNNQSNRRSRSPHYHNNDRNRRR